MRRLACFAELLTELSVRIMLRMVTRASLVARGAEFGGGVVGAPAFVANDYSLNGAAKLWFLDISAAASDGSLLYNAITKVAGSCFVPLTVGGGVRNLRTLESCYWLVPINWR